MLWLSLLFSAILVGILALVVRRGRVGRQAWLVPLCVIMLSCIFGSFPAFALSALVILILTGIFAWMKAPPRQLILSSIAVLIVAHLIAVVNSYQQLRTVVQKYPFESLAERLPKGKPPTGVLSRDPQYLTDQANGIPSYGNWHHRTDQLRDIHEHQVSMFINAPGFGVTRMMIHRSPWNLLSSGPSDVIVPQPESPLLRPSPPEADRIPANALTSKHDAMRGLHINAVTDFGDPFLTGYIRDREHVAGFIPHRLVELPAPSILAVELVGLLEHPEPVVYVSENLPRMDELRNAPTRPLDGFENAALERILKGDDIITATTPDGSRMLGAIRALKSCLLCHDAEYGDLLGAFSYRLNKER